MKVRNFGNKRQKTLLKSSKYMNCRAESSTLLGHDTDLRSLKLIYRVCHTRTLAKCFIELQDVSKTS